MRTYIVNIEASSSSITAFKHLPVSWTSRAGDRFVIMEGHAPSNVFRGAPNSFFDATIGVTLDNAWQPLGAVYSDTIYGPRVVFHRHSKDHQAAAMNQIALKLKFRHWNPIRTWSDCEEIHTRADLMMARPTGGARSIGQVVFDPSVITPDAIDALITLQNASTFPMALQERAGDAAVYSEATDKEHGEGFNSLKQHRIWSEYVTDIAQEWRILTDHEGKPWYFLQRKREKVGVIGPHTIAYGIGSQEKVSNWIARDRFSTMIADGAFSELMAFFDHIKAPLMAFDFYQTDMGRWGIFELCPEFGYQAVPNGHVQEHATAFIENWITSKVKELQHES